MNDERTATQRTLLAAASVMSIGGLALYGCAAAAGHIPIKAYKDAGCGCCKLWVAKLEAEGFTATIEDRADLGDLKQQLGVPMT